MSRSGVLIARRGGRRCYRRIGRGRAPRVPKLSTPGFLLGLTASASGVAPRGGRMLGDTGIGLGELLKSERPPR